ncbi:MAG: alpha/beta fold hydrolase [Deltaproteobacteria bacterium]|nr:alpha/beta fold hydrolase [Deltaproteobacteria bacterium]
MSDHHLAQTLDLYCSGIGAPLAASLRQGSAAPISDGANRVPPTLKVPVTVVLRIAAPRQSLTTGVVRGQLEVYAPDQTAIVAINNQEQPLEFDSTAALAYTLEGSSWYEFEVAGFLNSILSAYLPQEAPPDGLLLLHPPRRDRIPVVLVHGTASSPARWAELINEIEGDPWLRDRYQVWLFMYATGNPVGYSGGQLRQALEHVVREVDPTGTAPALRQMVVICHSQGGLLTKLTAVHSGTRFWDNISKVPLDALTVEPQTRTLIRQSLFFEPLPFVKRVIFISTPHRGSYQAALRLGRLASWFITLPSDLTQRMFILISQNQDKLLVQRMGKLPTSVDNMDPSSPFIQTLATIPVADGIAAHSIIAVQGNGLPMTGDDGIVKYESAHVEGVESEVVVHFGHSVQSHPQAIEEVRRILLLHGQASSRQ